jgi:tetratricopeptide (TPR) repeat protein
MGEASNAVFISYRRDVGGMIAMALHQHLTEHGLDTFYDIESIRAGQFDTIILSQIAARPYFLLVLTPGTLERCVEPTDWLRREIEQALKTQRVIVPAHTPNFDFGDIKRFLPNDLGEEVQRFHAQELSQKWFKPAVKQLVEEFLVPTEIEAVAPSAEEQKIVDRLHEAAKAAPAVTEDQLTAQEYFERAYARAAEDPEGAIADYSKAIRLNPKYAVAFNNRGIARRQIGDLEGARADERQAIRLESQAAAEAKRKRLELQAAAEAERKRLELQAAAEAERKRLELQAAAEAERKRRRRLFLIWGGVAVVALVFVVAAVVLIRDPSDDQDGQTTLLFEDDFSSDEQGWPDVGDEQIGGRYVNGAYQIHALKGAPNPPRVMASPGKAPPAEDVRIKVEAQTIRGSATAGYGYGIFCRADGRDNLYLFTVWASHARIEKVFGGTFHNLSDSAPDVTTSVEGDEVKELQAVCANVPGKSAVELELWVDGDPKLECTDYENPLEEGDYGLYTVLGRNAESGSTLEVEFENFAVANPVVRTSDTRCLPPP